MLNKKTTILIALSLTLLNTHANAGFFDNLADNLQNGDLGSLLTDVVKDVALEVQKSNDANQDTGTSFGSTTSDEDEYEEDYYEEYGLESELVTSVAPEAQGDRTVDGKDLTRKTSFFGPKDDKAYYKEESKPYTGVAITKYPNGKTKSIMNLVDGLQSGSMKDYHSNGNLESQYTVLNQKLEGKSEEYYSNGNKSKDMFFKNGELEGEYFAWYENGNKKSENLYLNGKKEGFQSYWYENGNQKKTFTTTKTIKHGEEKFWYENGQQKYVFNWIAGSQSKYLTEWHENGQKSYIFYRDGEHTYQNNWFKDGQRQKIVHWKNNKLSQYQTDWHENGQMRLESFYLDNVRKKATQWDEYGAVLASVDEGFRESMVVSLDDEKSVKEVEIAKIKTPATTQVSTKRPTILEALKDSVAQDIENSAKDIKEGWAKTIKEITDPDRYRMTVRSWNTYEGKTKLRIGDPDKLNFYTMDVVDTEKVESRIFDLGDILYRAEQRQADYSSKQTSLFSSDRNGKLVITVDVLEGQLSTLVFHLKDYLGYKISDSDRKWQARFDKLNATAIVSASDLRNRNLQSDIKSQRIAEMMLDSIFFPDKSYLPKSKVEKYNKLMGSIHKYKYLVSDLMKKDMTRKIGWYKPFQKEVKFEELPKSHPKEIELRADGLYHGLANNEPFTGTWTTLTHSEIPDEINENSILSIYTHAFEKEALLEPREGQLKIINPDYDKNQMSVMPIDKVQFTAENGVLTKVRGLYPQSLVGNISGPAFEVSIKDNKFEGEYVEYYKPGNRGNDGLYDKKVDFANIAKTVLYKDGKKDGYYRQYTPTTAITVEDGFGTKQSWYQPKLVSELNYDNGVLNGDFLFAYPQSMKPSETGSYKDGKKDGVWTKYKYSNLIPEYIESREIYVDGKPTNAYRLVNIDDLDMPADGKEAREKKNGELFTGNAISYFENGQLAVSAPFIDGKKDGKTFTFYPNGYPQTMTTFKNNQINGLTRKWDKNGYITNEAQFKDGTSYGIEKTFYSFEEMENFGHVYTDVAWATGDRRFTSKNKRKTYLDWGYTDATNKHAENAVAIYGENGLLYTDIIYSKRVMSHPSIGFSVYLPLKATITVEKSIPNGKSINYWPNGHIHSQGEVKNGKQHGDWSEYHAWRTNKQNTENLKMKISSYSNGDLIKESVLMTDDELNTYGGEVQSTSYEKDMGYVTGMRQFNTCFNCAATKETPKFAEGFELRRNIMNGTLQKDIAEVAQTQTTSKVWSQHELFTERLSTALVNKYIAKKREYFINARGDGNVFNWDNDDNPKYDRSSITGGTISTNVYFNKYTQPPLFRNIDRNGKVYMPPKQNVFDRSFSSEKRITDLSMAVVNYPNPHDKDFYGSEACFTTGVCYEDKSLIGRMCKFENPETTRYVNKKLVNLDRLMVPTNNSLLGMDMFLANKKDFDIYNKNGEYLDFLKNWNGPEVDNNAVRVNLEELKFDSGLFSSEYVLKSTGEEFSGWGVEYYPSGEISGEIYFDEGDRKRLFNYSKNGTITLDAYVDNKTINGASIAYYENGNLKKLELKIDGDSELPLIEYYENGTIKSDTLYWSGNEAGYRNTFYPNGQLEEQTLFHKSPDQAYMSLFTDGSESQSNVRIPDHGGDIISRVFCSETGRKLQEEEYGYKQLAGYKDYVKMRTVVRKFDEEGVMNYNDEGLEKRQAKISTKYKAGFVYIQHPKNKELAYSNLKTKEMKKQELSEAAESTRIKDFDEFLKETKTGDELRINTETMSIGPDGYCVFCSAEDRKFYFNGKRYTGVWFFKSDKTGIYSEMEVKDGMRNGLNEVWYANGNLHYSQTYIDNSVYGLAREFNEDGSPKPDIYFIDSSKVSKSAWNEYELKQSQKSKVAPQNEEKSNGSSFSSNYEEYEDEYAEEDYEDDY